MPFDADVLAQIDAAKEVDIETQAPDGRIHQTTIWAVVDADRVFVRSWRGATARWYREALANPAIALHVGRTRLPATAIPATDPDSMERASAGLLAKYPGNPSTPAMVADEVLDTTLRIEPA